MDYFFAKSNLPIQNIYDCFVRAFANRFLVQIREKKQHIVILSV